MFPFCYNLIAISIPDRSMVRHAIRRQSGFHATHTDERSITMSSTRTLSLSTTALVLLFAACGGGSEGGDMGGGSLGGAVAIDGSSTVFPISEAVAEEFQIENADVRVTVGFSGSGGGFKRPQDRLPRR